MRSFKTNKLIVNFRISLLKNVNNTACSPVVTLCVLFLMVMVLLLYLAAAATPLTHAM